MRADKADVIAFLRQCSGGELSDVMRHALAGRPEEKIEPGVFDYRLFLGFASRENLAERLDDVEWGPWKLSAIAYLNPARYVSDFRGEPFCQWGECEACGIELCSHVTQGLCPICRREVFLT